MIKINPINLLLLAVTITLYSCFSETKKTYQFSTKTICDCYGENNSLQIHSQVYECFDSLITSMNNSIDVHSNKDEIKMLFKSSEVKLINELTKKCLPYRAYYQNLAKTKFGSMNYVEAQEIITLNDSDALSEVDTFQLAEAYFSIDHFQTGINLLNQFILNNPKADYAFWMKSYGYYEINHVDSAIKALDSGIAVSKSDEFNNYLIYFKNVYLEPEKKDFESITIELKKVK